MKMRILAKILIVFIIATAFFIVGWQFLYSTALDPEEQIVLPLKTTGEAIARENGWGYTLINDMSGDPEYYGYRQDYQDSWNLFLDRVNRTLPDNGSILFASFSHDFRTQTIKQRYWLASRSGPRLIIAKLVQPYDRYPTPCVKFGLAGFYSQSWVTEITPESLILTKPPRDELIGFYCRVAFMHYLFFIFGLAIVLFLAGMFGLYGYFAKQQQKRKLDQLKEVQSENKKAE
jgi:hypothetical protein